MRRNRETCKKFLNPSPAGVYSSSSLTLEEEEIKTPCFNGQSTLSLHLPPLYTIITLVTPSPIPLFLTSGFSYWSYPSPLNSIFSSFCFNPSLSALWLFKRIIKAYTWIITPSFLKSFLFFLFS